MSLTVTPQRVTEAFASALRADLTCVEEDGALRLDTPLTLQDGHLLRVYLVVDQQTGQVQASDGGFAASELAHYTSSRASLRQRQAALRQIARDLALDWDEEFRLTEPDLEAAVRRVPVLAMAVDRALTLLQPSGRRPRAPLQARLRGELCQAGLKVERRSRLDLGPEREGVTVDYRVRRNGSEAAVEVLASLTAQGARIAVDRTAANFNILRRWQYPGLLVAVFDEASPVGDQSLLRRLQDAGPHGTLVLPGRDAAQTIAARLAH